MSTPHIHGICPDLQMRGTLNTQVLENTSDSAFSRHDSAALSRPDSFMVSMGGMGPSARTAARRNPCFQHPAHPHRLKTARVVLRSSFRSLKP